MYEHIIFDLDGTLTDPKVGILRSMNYALTSCGLAGIDEGSDAHLWVIGPPLRESFVRILGKEGDLALVEKLVEKYRERFERVGIFENSLYPGVEALLRGLKEDGRSLAVATTKPAVYAKRIVKHYGVEGIFDAVVGSELDGRNSDKSDLINRVMAASGGKTAGYVMVGDREFDVLGARKAGIDSIGVLYGYGSESEMAASKPAHVARTVEELKRLLGS